MGFGDHDTGGKFLKIEDEIEVALIGEEVSGPASFDNGYQYDPAGKFRFGVNVFDGKKIMILEGTGGLYKAMGKVAKAHGQDVWIRVSKTGSGKDTRYGAEYARDLTDEDRAAIRECDPYDLSEECPWATPKESGF
jgi:hypothetical protein